MKSSRLVLFSGAAVLLAALASPPVVPLYDGVGFPDEPYRYVGMSGTPGPSSINQTLSISDLDQYGAAASSQESGPQISVYFQQHSVKASGSSFTVVATPTAPTIQPAPGSVAGDVYVVTASSKSGAPKFDSSKSAVFLRLPGDKPMYKVAIVYRVDNSAQWRAQFTTKTGNDIFKAGFLGPGQYAIATGVDMPSKTSHPNGFEWLQPILKFLPWVLFTGVIVSIILVIRFRKPKPPHHDR